MPPNTMPRLSMPLLAGASTVLLALLGGCTVIPARGYPPADDREVVAIYDFAVGGPHPVRIPASSDGLSILRLRTEPSGLRETFSAGRRYVHPHGDRLILRCRYRARQQHNGDGTPRPLPKPRDLFPGATELRTLQHHDAWSSG